MELPERRRSRSITDSSRVARSRPVSALHSCGSQAVVAVMMPLPAPTMEMSAVKSETLEGKKKSQTGERLQITNASEQEASPLII